MQYGAPDPDTRHTAFGLAYAFDPGIDIQHHDAHRRHLQTVAAVFTEQLAEGQTITPRHHQHGVGHRAGGEADAPAHQENHRQHVLVRVQRRQPGSQHRHQDDRMQTDPGGTVHDQQHNGRLECTEA